MDVERLKEEVAPRRFSPNDDLPEEYKKTVTNMLQFHANSEFITLYMEKPFVEQAPSLDMKLAVSAKVQDEIGHGMMLFDAAAPLGVKSRKQMLEEFAEGTAPFVNTHHYPVETWGDMTMIFFLIDRAGSIRQKTLKDSSYLPYAHAMDKICFEEGFHVRQGEAIVKQFMEGSKAQQEHIQESFNKWWPRALRFFGPPEEEGMTGFAAEAGLKLKSNDELRNEYLNNAVPKIKKYGLELPDTPRVTEDSDGNYRVNTDDLDWKQFSKVIQENHDPAGNIQSHSGAMEANEWVTEILDGFEDNPVNNEAGV